MIRPPVCFCCTPSSNLLNAPAKERIQRLRTVLLLVSGFSGFELVMGRISHSLALLADGGHLIFDSLALGLALLAAWLTQRSLSRNSLSASFNGWAALVNSLGLILMAAWIGWEAIARLQATTHEVLSLPMLIAATIGVGVNSVNARLLHHHRGDDLNIQGAYLHVVADITSSIGVIIAAIAVWLLHWHWADCAIGILVAVLISLSALPLIYQSVRELTTQKQVAQNVPSNLFWEVGATDLETVLNQQK